MKNETVLVGFPQELALQTEILRLNKVVKALMDRAERSTAAHGSDFNMFQSTIMLEEQVRRRTAELDAAVRENERINHALRESEAKFRGLVSQSLVGIALIEHGIFSYANPKLSEMFGYSFSELTSLSPVDLAIPDDRCLVAEQVRGRLRGDVDRVEYVFRGRRKDGSMLDIECHNSLMNTDRSPVLISLLLDITQRIAAAREVQKLQDKLREQAIHDALTGLYNRQSLTEFFDRELHRAAHRGQPVTVIMADIDHFKAVNDGYGHRGGDEVLRVFGKLLREYFRSSDICCRYGGEEFLLLIPDVAIDMALKRTEQFRSLVENSPVPHGGSPISFTASFGVASYPEHGSTPGELINAADAALYKAKQAGRNRVMACG